MFAVKKKKKIITINCKDLYHLHIIVESSPKKCKKVQSKNVLKCLDLFKSKYNVFDVTFKLFRYTNWVIGTFKQFHHQNVVNNTSIMSPFLPLKENVDAA